jgi:two-component system, NtrC family, sensor kinase
MYYGSWQLSGLFLLAALYTLLGQKKGWVFWGIIGLSGIGFFINSWVYSTVIVGSMIQLEQVRTGFRALKLKTKGAWIITAGAICFLFIEGAFVIGVYLELAYWFYPLSDQYILADLLYAAGSLCFPVSTVVYIALDFAFTSQRLNQKLIEVNELSKNKLEQEKEKQQILAGINETLEKQVTERTAELTKSLSDLKSTQSQLIQSEKMASLGELTAGIAHEIQNPLNFVNNFSEVNKELIRDLKSEIQRGNLEEVNTIANDIESNEEKIVHHGKRADAIVKGMLQHSRSSSGQKELTDINALCDEYLRLSYHGLRAKDKSFNAKFETYLDPTLPRINVVPQDIGRVILNLINNAFYAVTLRLSKGDDGYEPTVTVSTKYLGVKIEISVKDNGSGIPDAIKEKIFQPFFTTKPTGQGTGLGLSLSYDIMKAHGGEFKVETREGKGSTFIIEIPA